MSSSSPRRGVDRALVLSLGLAAVLALNGLWWGWYESWNPDDWALKDLLTPGRAPLEPPTFLKPPFHTYLNFFLAVLPLRAIQKVINTLTHAGLDLSVAILYCSRIIQVGLFLGVVGVTYQIGARAYTRKAAQALALVVATSAGFVAQTHFLTADIAVTFWMLVSFLAAQSILRNGRTRDYVAAGLLTGLATATKYNGLAVGLAIPIFHYFLQSNRRVSVVRILLDRRLWLGVWLVPVGFVIGSPYAVVRFQRFLTDFVYNYTTIDYYTGFREGTGYVRFIGRIAEVLGVPMAIVAIASALGALTTIRRDSTVARATTVAALGVVAIYFLKFGSSPRVEVRFVLPIVPLLLMPAASLVSRVATDRRALNGMVVGALGGAIAYNVLASLWVGYRFAADPRMDAVRWLASHVSEGSTIEASPYSPTWSLYVPDDVTETRMPRVSGRGRLFRQVFADDTDMFEEVQHRIPEPRVGWYNASALAVRHPDFITLDSLYYQRFVTPPFDSLYPEVKTYMTALLNGELGYRVVYRRRSVTSPDCLYPDTLKFVDNEIVVLAR